MVGGSDRTGVEMLLDAFAALADTAALLPGSCEFSGAGIVVREPYSDWIQFVMSLNASLVPSSKSTSQSGDIQLGL